MRFIFASTAIRCVVSVSRWFSFSFSFISFVNFIRSLLFNFMPKFEKTQKWTWDGWKERKKLCTNTITMKNWNLPINLDLAKSHTYCGSVCVRMRFMVQLNEQERLEERKKTAHHRFLSAFLLGFTILLIFGCSIVASNGELHKSHALSSHSNRTKEPSNERAGKKSHVQKKRTQDAHKAHCYDLNDSRVATEESTTEPTESRRTE